MLQQLRTLVLKTPLGRSIKEGRRLKALAAWGAEEDRRAAFYRTFIPAGGLAFDIGANNGNRTKVFLALGATVVTVEPQPQCAETLDKMFRRNSRFHLVAEAVGAEEGTAEMLICEADIFSTLSTDWIDRVEKSGRYDHAGWSERVTVKVTTLEQLIARFGRPDFVKIDVEGFELQVLKGLNSPVPAMSVEFHPELIDDAFLCIDRMAAVGLKAFNLSLGESLTYVSDAWFDAAAFKAHLEQYRGDAVLYGDIYGRSS